MPIKQNSIFTGTKQELLEYFKSVFKDSKEDVLKHANNDIKEGGADFSHQFSYSWEMEDHYRVEEQLKHIIQNVKLSCNNGEKVITEQEYGYIGQIFYMQFLDPLSVEPIQISMCSIYVRILPDNYYQKLEESAKEYSPCCEEGGCSCKE